MISPNDQADEQIGRRQFGTFDQQPSCKMASTKCTVCGKDQANECTRCKAAAYCSTECQRNDFPLHKLLCSKYQAFLETRPIPKDEDKKPGDVKPVVYKAAILFPKDSDNPQLIWLKLHIRSEIDPEYEEVEYPESHYWENPVYHLTDFMDAPTAMPHKQNGQNLNIYMGDHCFGNEPYTKCLLTLNAGYESCERGSIAAAPWAGNLVVVNITKSEVKHPENPQLYGPKGKVIHSDANLSHLRYAFYYLTRKNYIFESGKQNPYYIRKPGRWFKAVKLCCDGEMKFEGKKQFTEVTISRSHPVFSQNSGVSSISKHLGFPLLVKRIPPNPNWNEKMAQLPRNKKFDPYENLDAVCLMVDVEVASMHWGLAPKIWDRGEDLTVLVVRKDMKDITACQVEVLSNYCQLEVSWNMAAVMEQEMCGGADGADEVHWVVDEETGEPSIPTDRARAKFIDDYLRSDKFANYFEEFKQNKVSKGDATWADATLPPKGSVPDKIVETKEERHEAMLRMIGML